MNRDVSTACSHLAPRPTSSSLTENRPLQATDMNQHRRLPLHARVIVGQRLLMTALP
jgi:hypothetical protein